MPRHKTARPAETAPQQADVARSRVFFEMK
jgi:hypothetical protein